MNQNYSQEIGYQETSAGQFVSLPLAGRQLSVVFALPKTDLATLTTSLTKHSFNITGESSVILSLPKFDFTSGSFSLAKTLTGLGMVQAFDQTAADFKGPCTDPPDGDNLYIADVLQKATLAVAETGVEAAAATAVVVAGFANVSGGSGPAVVNLDHPCLVSIVDNS